MGIHKPFDRKLYEQNDSIAKQKVLELMQQFPTLKAIENPKKRGVDILIYKEEQIVAAIETERKLKWVGDSFPFPNVNIPERKEKLCSLDVPVIFLMFSKNWDQYLTITCKDLLASDKKIVPNRLVAYGEEFFQVNLGKVYFNALELTLKRIGVL